MRSSLSGISHRESYSQDRHSRIPFGTCPGLYDAGLSQGWTLVLKVAGSASAVMLAHHGICKAAIMSGNTARGISLSEPALVTALLVATAA